MTHDYVPYEANLLHRIKRVRIGFGAPHLTKAARVTTRMSAQQLAQQGMLYALPLYNRGFGNCTAE